MRKPVEVTLNKPDRSRAVDLVLYSSRLDLALRLFNRKPEACASLSDTEAHASGLRLNEMLRFSPATV